MTPAQAIAALDRQLVAHGQTVTLRIFNRDADGAVIPDSYVTPEITARAKVKPTSNEELAAGIDMAGRRLTLSPSDAGAYEPEVHKDAVVISGTERTVSKWTPIEMNDQVVRIEAELD